jgi:hypothetical protein
MMHKIGAQLADCECHFTPFYTGPVLSFIGRTGLLDFTVAFGELREKTKMCSSPSTPR